MNDNQSSGSDAHPKAESAASAQGAEEKTAAPQSSATAASQQIDASAADPVDAGQSRSEAAKAEALAAQIAELKAQNQELEDRFKRAWAEMQNVQRRAERDVVDAKKYALSRFAEDLVKVGDNFQRAMQAVPQDAQAEDSRLKSVIDGVAMIEREFLNVLSRNGIVRFDAKGAIFDPNRHEAMAQVQNPAVPAGTIIDVFEQGYMIGDRVLRAAKVVVAQGGPRPIKPAEDKPADGASANTSSEAAASEGTRPDASDDGASRQTSDQGDRS